MRRILVAATLAVLVWTITGAGAALAAPGLSFEDLCQEGSRRLAAAKGEEAYTLFAQALAVRPGSLEAQLGMMEALRFTQRKTKADDILRLSAQVLAVDPKCARAYQARGYAYSCLYDEAAMNAAYRKGIEVDPRYLPCYYDLGLSYLLAGRNDDALAVYRQAVSAAPSDAEAHAKLGDCYAWLEQYDDATQEYERSLGLAPEQAGAHRGLAQVFKSLGDNEAAIAEWKSAMAAQPGVPSDHVELGDLYDLVQRRTDAAGEYKTATGLDPSYSLAHNRLGWVYSGLGQSQEALEQGEVVLALAGADFFEQAQGHLLVGVGLAGLGQHGQAIAEIREALRLMPDFPFALYRLGLVQAEAGMRSEALETYEALAKMNEYFAQELSHYLNR